MIDNGYKISFGGDKSVLKLDCGDGCTTLNTLKTTELYILFLFIYFSSSF